MATSGKLSASAPCFQRILMSVGCPLRPDPPPHSLPKFPAFSRRLWGARVGLPRTSCRLLVTNHPKAVPLIPGEAVEQHFSLARTTIKLDSKPIYQIEALEQEKSSMIADRAVKAVLKSYGTKR